MPFVISPARLTHITIGDQSGGGHMAGAAGNGAKFPAGWGPVEINAAILAVAPTITNWQQQPHGNWRGSGRHTSGIHITVILYEVQNKNGDWRVCTAWP